ncbi:MAG: hypothetical protein KIS81_05585 [Maricaulaceae bacterium]|nr:hypothetical protein [Maricaulaceae bacterium]
MDSAPDSLASHDGDRRFEETLKRMLNTPSKPHKEKPIPKSGGDKVSMPD